MTENPYESTDQPHGAMGSVWPKIFWRVVIYGGIIVVLVALLLPATRSAPEARRRVQCTNNMKQILLALQSYHDEHGELPPAYTVDAEGNRLHSWRALILPYVEGNTVYKLIDYSKPWDAPENEAARDSVVEPFICPSSLYDDEHLTTYVTVVGPEFLFDGSNARSFASVRDGTSNTIAVIEIGHEHAVHWMSPQDVDEAFVFEKTEENLRTGHPGMFMAGFLDGHAQAIQHEIDPKQLRAMLTIAGGEELEH